MKAAIDAVRAVAVRSSGRSRRSRSMWRLRSRQARNRVCSHTVADGFRFSSGQEASSAECLAASSGAFRSHHPRRRRRLRPRRCPADSGRAIRVGGNVGQPQKVKHVAPVYPPIAQSARVQGVVIVEAIIDREGRVGYSRILRSIPLLDQAALDAVKQWEFTQTHLNGAPVPVIMTVTVQFAPLVGATHASPRTGGTHSPIRCLMRCSPFHRGCIAEDTSMTSRRAQLASSTVIVLISASAVALIAAQELPRGRARSPADRRRVSAD